MKNLGDKCKVLYFKENGDDRGHLVVVEGSEDIPFDIKRVFYIYGSDTNIIRGMHANLKTEFVLINVSGTSKVKVDDGINQEIIELNKPHMGVYMNNMIWKEMYDFSKDSVLLVLASEHYEASEYVRDYNDFLKIINQSN